MSIEGIVAKMHVLWQEKFTKDTKNLEYQLKVHLKSGKLLKMAKKNDCSFIILEKDKKDKIVAVFLSKEDNCIFQTYMYGGFQADFGKSKDLILYQRSNSIYAINNINGKKISVRFFEDDDGKVKYETNLIKSKGIGIL